MTLVSYQPALASGWIAAVAENRLLFMEVTASNPAIESLWRSLGSSRGVQAVLDDLIREGVSVTPPFVLVEWGASLGAAPARVKAIVRGSVTFSSTTAAGTSVVDAGGVSTWLEREFTDVLGCVIEVAAVSRDATNSLMLPLASGMAWAHRIVLGQSSAQGPESDLPPAATPLAVDEPRTQDEPKVQDEPKGQDWVDPEETVAELTSVNAVVPPVEVHVPEDPASSAAEGGSYDYLFGETVFRTVEDAAVREGDEGAVVAPAGEKAGVNGLGDHDGHTIASADIAKLRASRKSRGASGTTAPPPPAPSLYLELSDGSREALSQPILVGRAPSVSNVPGGQVPKLLTIGGRDQDISRNHVQFAVAGGTVVVTDLHSRNGTMVILPGRSPQQLRQGEPTSVIVGTVVDLGNGVTFTVGEE